MGYELEIEELIRVRYQPKAPVGLAQRTVDAAKVMPQSARVRSESLISRFVSYVAGFVDDVLFLPQPAYAIVLLLVGGFLIGANGDYIALSDDINVSGFSDYLSIDDDFTAADFLAEELN